MAQENVEMVRRAYEAFSWGLAAGTGTGKQSRAQRPLDAA
jgi:hypothetical protein